MRGRSGRQVGETCQIQIGVKEQNPGLVIEFFRNVPGLTQDIQLNKTEDELLEDLKVLTARRKARPGSNV